MTQCTADDHVTWSKELIHAALAKWLTLASCTYLESSVVVLLHLHAGAMAHYADLCINIIFPVSPGGDGGSWQCMAGIVTAPSVGLSIWVLHQDTGMKWGIRFISLASYLR